MPPLAPQAPSPSLPAPAIEARGLRKHFGPVTAVDGLDLTVAPGEIFGLVGPDGAGKTTTIRLLCGAMPPDSGAARVAGFDVVAQGEEAKRRLGYVPQRSSLYGELTVEENLLFQARVHGVKGETFAARRERLLIFSRLGRFKGRLARDLSGGMRQKLALACTLIHEPEVLLLDEPTTGVDPVSRAEFWELLLGLANQGIAILTSTPYMDEAERCAQVGLIYEGRLLAGGTPEQVRQRAGLELLEVRVGQQRQLLPAQAAARGAAGVTWAEIFGDRVHVAAPSAVHIEEPLRETLRQAGVQVTAVSRMAPGLEDAFFELVQRARARPRSPTASQSGKREEPA